MLLRFLNVLLILVTVSACATKPQPIKSSAKTDDVACLSEAMYFEARGTGYEGLRAVGEVVLNRVSDSRFPSTVCEVVDDRQYGSCQFSYRCDGKPETYDEPAEQAKAIEIANELLTNRTEDISKGALFFVAINAESAWFRTRTRVSTVGGHHFYK